MFSNKIFATNGTGTGHNTPKKNRVMKLDKRTPFLMVLFILLICVWCFETVNANSNESPPSFEEKYAEAGYKSVKAAVKEFENHFKW
ncbi:hypothetical protein [Lysinibacillus sp. NPDC092081]|uniref:hypothetical protein n=1 Tax=Lysinibacillus sp. NPDC092081 TaxID=3364131 RepID=UPI003809648D